MNFISQETHFLAYQLIASTIILYLTVLKKKNDKPHICKMFRLSVESN